MKMAYAALLSLAQILHQTLNRDYQYLILDEKKQIESLVEEVTFLRNCLSSQKITRDMETKIRDAAYIAEDIIESHIIDRFLTESAGHEDGSKEKILIRFDVMELWFVNSSNSGSDSRFQSRSPLRNARVGEIEKPRTFFQIINGIRELAKTRRFKAWFLDPSCFLHNGGRPLPDAMWASERLATYDTKMVITGDSPLPASTIMEELRIHGFDTSLFVGAITSEDLRRRAGDPGLEEVGRSLNSLNSYYPYNFARGSTSPEMYKSAMEMAGVDAADHCIAVGCRSRDIKAASDAGISSIFVTAPFYGIDLVQQIDRITRELTLKHGAHPTFVIPAFTW